MGLLRDLQWISYLPRYHLEIILGFIWDPRKIPKNLKEIQELYANFLRVPDR
jgi:hypothetical protein